MATSYLLKITLQDTYYPIWRQFVVPSDITLDRLHDVVQITMGWESSHMHAFIIDKQYYKAASVILEDPFPNDDLPEDDYTLDSFAVRKGKKFRYLYDFGEHWVHEIVVENTNYEAAADQAAIFCVKGVGQCPPEDCGGVSGFTYFCKAITNPRNVDYENMLMWYGSDFDPDDFDIDDVNKALGKMFAPKKTAKKTTKKVTKKASKKTGDKRRKRRPPK